MPKLHYPTLYFTCGEEIKLPDQGSAMIKFRKVECSENTRDPESPKYRYELEVHGIEVKAGKVEEDAEAPIDALKKGMRKALKKEEE